MERSTCLTPWSRATPSVPALFHLASRFFSTSIGFCMSCITPFSIFSLQAAGKSLGFMYPSSAIKGFICMLYLLLIMTL
ncbi:hypothetical protein F4818DRAFT_404640 [Hypoxylon cercidicola]|nr:hypothetical protein F4818DRAFT_404640 [Hypoxylon cercidicola]